MRSQVFAFDEEITADMRQHAYDPDETPESEELAPILQPRQDSDKKILGFMDLDLTQEGAPAEISLYEFLASYAPVALKSVGKVQRTYRPDVPDTPVDDADLQGDQIDDDLTPEDATFLDDEGADEFVPGSVLRDSEDKVAALNVEYEVDGAIPGSVHPDSEEEVAPHDVEDDDESANAPDFVQQGDCLFTKDGRYCFAKLKPSD